MLRTCETCKWRSDDFTSACTNGDSEYCADFVSADDTCEWWEQKKESNPPHTLDEYFEKHMKQIPGDCYSASNLAMPENLPEFVKKWCIPMLGAETYFPDLFGKYGETFTGICDGWNWHDQELSHASEKDLWQMLAIASTYWMVSYEKWYDDLKGKYKELEDKMKEININAVACPLCGGMINVYQITTNQGMDGVSHEWRFRCTKCGLVNTDLAADSFYGRQYFATKADAIAEWNRMVRKAVEEK